MDPHLGKRRSDEASASNGSHASPGSHVPSDDPRSASGPLPDSARRERRSRRASGPTLVQALSSGWDHALELGDYVKSMIGVRRDRAMLEVRRKTTKIGMGVIAGLGLATIVIAASLRLVVGLSEGFAELFGGRPWLGDLAAAVLLLGGLAGGGAWYVSRREKKELEEHIEKYERNHREHRARHGRHVADPVPPNLGGAPRP